MTWNSRVKECIENILEKEIYSTMCDIQDIVQSNTPSPEGCPPVLLDSLKDILSNIDSIQHSIEEIDMLNDYMEANRE